MEPDLRLDKQLCFALYIASRASSQVYRDALAHTGLTYPQYLVMLALWEADGLTIGELGERLHLDSGTLSPLVTRLEGSGFVLRSRPDADARRVRVNVTPSGWELRDEAERIHCALVDALDLTPEESTLLRDLSHRLVAAIGRQKATA